MEILKIANPLSKRAEAAPSQDKAPSRLSRFSHAYVFLCSFASFLFQHTRAQKYVRAYARTEIRVQTCMYTQRQFNDIAD